MTTITKYKQYLILSTYVIIFIPFRCGYNLLFKEQYTEHEFSVHTVRPNNHKQFVQRLNSVGITYHNRSE